MSNHSKNLAAGPSGSRPKHTLRRQRFSQSLLERNSELVAELNRVKSQLSDAHADAESKQAIINEQKEELKRQKTMAKINRRIAQFSTQESLNNTLLELLPTRCRNQFAKTSQTPLHLIYLAMSQLCFDTEAKEARSEYPHIMLIPHDKNEPILANIPLEGLTPVVETPDPLLFAFEHDEDMLSLILGTHRERITRELRVSDPITAVSIDCGTLVALSWPMACAPDVIHTFLNNLVAEFSSQCTLENLQKFTKHACTGLMSHDVYSVTRKSLHHKFFTERRAAHLTFLLDLDNFKQFNSNYGMPIGDIILEFLGSILRNSIRPDEDILYQRGGDEVGGMILLSGTDNPVASAESFFARIRHAYAVQMPQLIKENQARISAIAVASGRNPDAFSNLIDHIPGISIGGSIPDLLPDQMGFLGRYAEPGNSKHITSEEISYIENLSDRYLNLSKSLGRGRTCTPHSQADRELLPLFEKLQEFVAGHFVDGETDQEKVLRSPALISAFRSIHGTPFSLEDTVTRFQALILDQVPSATVVSQS